MNRNALLVVLLAASLAGCQSITGATIGSPWAEPFVATNEPDYLGHQYFARADYALAERSFRAAVERNPADATSWVGLAASYDHLARFELADRAYAQAIKLSGVTFEILNNQGFSYLLRGDPSRAELLLRRARGLRPTDPVVSNNLTLLTETRT